MPNFVCDLTICYRIGTIKSYCMAFYGFESKRMTNDEVVTPLTNTRSISLMGNDNRMQLNALSCYKFHNIRHVNTFKCTASFSLSFYHSCLSIHVDSAIFEMSTEEREKEGEGHKEMYSIDVFLSIDNIQSAIQIESVLVTSVSI